MSKENNNDKILKDAQYRKGLSIAFFNATNATIELAKVMFPDMQGVDAKAFIQEWREWFLEEHKNYYATVIANVGKNYKVQDSIKKLQDTKTYEDLSNAWRALSEDERRDDEIIKVAKEERNKYNEKV